MRSYQIKPVTITANATHAVGKLAGWSIREAAGMAGAATVRLRDGSVAGQVIAVIELAADRSETVEFSKAVWPDGDVYVEVVAGTVEGVLYDWR